MDELLVLSKQQTKDTEFSIYETEKQQVHLRGWDQRLFDTFAWKIN